MRTVLRRSSRKTLRNTLLLALPALAHAGESTGPEVVDTVIVTGSRIRSDAGESTGPVTAMSNEQLNRGGNDSLGKVLQTLPYNTGGPTNTNVNNGGDGSTRVSLRGLGPQRTLVLLNGRRLPNGGIGADSSVDVDSLPLSMVERVEVLTTGASAVYGADAVGGVLNVITRSGFNGLELGVQGSQADRGDGTISRAQALFGTDIGSGNWMLGADYVEQEGVSQGAREYSAVPLVIESTDGTRVATGSLSIPDGRFGVRPGNTLGLSPGIYTRVAGATGQEASDWRPATDADVFNYAPYNYLQTPNERWSLWLLGQQPLGDDMELFMEGLFSHRESSQNLAPSPYIVPTNASPVSPQGRPYLPSTNYYNPFGVDILMGTRRLVELDDRGYQQRVEMWRALAGVRGRLGDWNWEVSIAAAESDALTRELGLPVNDRFAAAVGPSGPDASGRIVCGTRDPASGIVPASAVIAGCVPINVFGGAGSITQDQLDYVSGPLADNGSNSQRLANLGFDGSWGRLPAGEIQWAFGAEFRRESGEYLYDPQRISGAVGDGLSADIPGGSFEAREGYVETRLPLFSATDGSGDVDATLGGRLSDFSSFGMHTTWHAGLRWELSKSWVLRADYTTLFRAPALNELYEAQVTNATFGLYDPCGREPTPEQQQNCAANGVPGGSYAQTDDDVSALDEGGNPGLEPEAGYSFDTGIEFHSAGSTRWQASLDFFRTQLDGYVERMDPNVILDECATSGTALACSKIQRFDTGALRRVDARHNNLGRVTLQGLDLTGAIDLATPIGDVTLHALVSDLLEYDVQAFEGSETVSRLGRDNSGHVLPEWRALAGVEWTRGSWGASYTMQWIGPYTNYTFTESFEEYYGHVPSVFYHDVDASVAWRGLVLRAGVTNLTDEDPPYLNGAANTNPATYRLLGRTYFLQLSYALN